MSLNPKLGHLYHDHSISNSYTVLDAKEKMKTREINARESKYLDKYTCVLEKAKYICQRKNNWEQRHLRKQLESINTKTMSLDKGLKRESQRMKLFDDVLNEEDSRSSRPATFINTRLLRNRQRNNFISSRSLFSNVSSEQQNSVKQSKINDEINGRYGDNSKYVLSKTEKLVRKADQVTKSLHKLYTRNLEKRWKDANRTIIDVLTSESNDELQRALFVLRGTHAGNLIEDILRERELSKRARSETYERQKWSLSSNNSDGLEQETVFITEINIKDGSEILKRMKDKKASTPVNERKHKELCKMKDRDENDCTCDAQNISDGTEKRNGKLPESEKLQESYSAEPENGAVHHDEDFVMDSCRYETKARDNVGSYREETESTRDTSSESDSFDRHEKGYQTYASGFKADNSKKWISVADVHLDLHSISEKGSPDLVSSTIVNPSEREQVTTLKWREIFKTPEVWKQNRRAVQSVKKSNAISLVKVHGQYRQTMLK